MDPTKPFTPRSTLKLKPGIRKSPRESKSVPPPKPQSKLSQKSGAAWSDEYKQRMQEDMDALISRCPGRVSVGIAAAVCWRPDRARDSIDPATNSSVPPTVRVLAPRLDGSRLRPKRRRPPGRILEF